MNSLRVEIEGKLRDLIEAGDYESADQVLADYLEEEQAVYDDMLAIFDAAIGEYYGEGRRRWEAIRRGLCINPRNYELYVMLGDYYLDINLRQSWLCYENALFYCEDEADRIQIRGLMRQLEEKYGISVPKVAVIILSRDLLEYTKLCVESIRQTVPKDSRQIIVVDNAFEDGSGEWLRQQKDLVLIEKQENRSAPAGYNQGIAASDKDVDIFLLNNDTVLPENALFWLRMGLYEAEKNGTAGSVSNCAGGNQEVLGLGQCGDLAKLFDCAEKINVPIKYPCEKRIYLMGFALLIKRTVLDQVGLLDEQFIYGNYEDYDYGMRVLEAGYHNVLCKNSFIICFGSQTSCKDSDEHRDMIQSNSRKLDEKWGFHVQYYLRPRPELSAQIDEPAEKAFRLLDVGCGCGALIGHVKGNYPNASVYGVELVTKAAEFAKEMGEVICKDVEHMEFPWPKEFFDYIVMGDVLEHLDDPQKVLMRLFCHLKCGGHIIVSMPNVKHYTVMFPLLLQNRFTYKDEGVLDRTHRKMYTKIEIAELIMRSGYKIEMMEGLASGETEEQRRRFEKILAGMNLPDIQNYFDFQYLVKAVKTVPLS